MVFCFGRYNRSRTNSNDTLTFSYLTSAVEEVAKVSARAHTLPLVRANVAPVF